MNLDVKQVGGSVLVISAFTVQADARRGRRPSFEDAEGPDRAAVLYEMFCDELIALGLGAELAGLLPEKRGWTREQTL